MNWIQLTDLEQLNLIEKESFQKPIVIFKHSTRCSISGTALSRFERNWDEDTPCYYLDLITYRPISSGIAEKFAVEHQSPQILLIQKGQCTYHASHWDIEVNSLKKEISKS